MTSKPPRSLTDMASEAVGGLQCPKCGCCNFKTYGVSKGIKVIFRYKECRNKNCGHRILTSTKSDERIIRDVNTHDKGDDEGDDVLLRFG